MYYVYVLYNKTKLYLGYTADLKRRVREHNYNKVISTKNRYYKLIFYEAFLNKKDAQRRERYFKTSKGKKALRLMLREYFNET